MVKVSCVHLQVDLAHFIFVWLWSHQCRQVKGGHGVPEREEVSTSSLSPPGRKKTEADWGEGVADSGMYDFSPLPLSLCFSSCGKAFQIMMWIDVQQLSPLLGPVRHLTGHRWQHYDGLGIVIQDACHLFTSRPSLISHHRPYNLADTPPTPAPHCQTRYTRQHHTLQQLFFSPFFPLTFLSLSLLHPWAEHSQHI